MAASENLILEHYESPYHKGVLTDATHRHQLRIPTCGDHVNLQLKILDRTIVEAYFDGRGCIVSQAAASILCEFAEGQTIDVLKDFQAKNMLALLRVRLTPLRQQCGLLAFKALKTILYSLDEADGRLMGQA